MKLWRCNKTMSDHGTSLTIFLSYFPSVISVAVANNERLRKSIDKQRVTSLGTIPTQINISDYTKSIQWQVGFSIDLKCRCGVFKLGWLFQVPLSLREQACLFNQLFQIRQKPFPGFKAFLQFHLRLLWKPMERLCNTKNCENTETIRQYF